MTYVSNLLCNKIGAYKLINSFKKIKIKMVIIEQFLSLRKIINNNRK
jgi:hypothetical protein